MAVFIKFISVIISLYFFYAHANAGLCNKRALLQSNDECITEIANLHPTQFVVGMYSVSQKRAELEERYIEGKLQKYLKKKIVPVIIGPDERFYLLDRHHMSLALFKANIPVSAKQIHIKVLHNWSGLSFQNFYHEMIKQSYVFLNITGYGLQPIEKLPKHIVSLEDDPYRSLAWIVREMDGYQKVDMNYLEFIWANYFFEQGINIKDSSLESLKNSVSTALDLAHHEAARELPGYIDNLEN